MLRLQADEAHWNVDLDERLESLIVPGFEEFDGCVVLRSQVGETTPSLRSASRDETEFEALVNHVHVDDVLVTADRGELIGQAAAFAHAVRDALRVAFPARDFEVVLAISDSTVVRFYGRRDDQPWLLEDLDQYAEAIMVLHATATAPRWRLMRQDEHGNVVAIGDFRDRAEADAACAQFLARKHHQHYWVQSLPPAGTPR